MTILLVGVTETSSSTNHGIKKAFETAGHTVHAFNYREIAKDYTQNHTLHKYIGYLRRIPLLRRLYFQLPNRKRMNQLLLKEATKYHLVFFAKTDSVDWKTIKKITQKTFTWYFFMDPPDVARQIQAHRYAKEATWSSATFTSVLKTFPKTAHWILEGEDSSTLSLCQKTIDVIFVGTPDKKRTQFIHALKRTGITIQWYGKNAPLPELFHEDLIRHYQSAKIILNINREGDGFSNRIIQGLLSGSFVLTEHSQDLEKTFQKETHLDWFHTTEECAQKIKSYLKDEEKREKIASQGKIEALTHHTWDHTISTISTHITPSFLIPMNTGIGNAVLLTPLLHTIKENYPNATITLLTNPKKGLDPLFPNYRIIHHVDNQKYDVFFHTMLGSNKKWALQVKLKNPNCQIITQYYQARKGPSPSGEGQGEAALRTASNQAPSIPLKGDVKIRFQERLFNPIIGTKSIPIDPKQHESEQYLQLFPCQNPIHTVSLTTPTITITLPEKPYCVIQLGAAFNIPDSKNWPIQHWKELLLTLADHITILLVGSPNETQLAQDITHPNIQNHIGKTPLDHLVHLLKNAQFFLGVDSGIGHISGTLNQNTLILWGPTDFTKSHQVGTNTHFINRHKPCAPCRGPSQMGLYNGPDSINACKINQACMTEITPDLVFKKLKDLFWI